MPQIKMRLRQLLKRTHSGSYRHQSPLENIYIYIASFIERGDSLRTSPSLPVLTQTPRDRGDHSLLACCLLLSQES